MPINDEKLSLHLKEADNIKKEWFTYVFNSIQTLNDKLEANSIQIKQEKEELLKLLIKYKDSLMLAIEEKDSKSRDDLEKLKCKVEDLISAIKNKLSVLTANDASLKLQLETDLNALKDLCRIDIDKALTKHSDSAEKISDRLETRIDSVEGTLNKANIGQAVLTTQVKVYVIIISLIISAFVTALSGGILVLFKDAIKAYFGG